MNRESVLLFLCWCLWACGDDAASEDHCSPVDGFRVVEEQRCMEARTELDGVCLLETAPDSTSGQATEACLTGSDGSTYIVAGYGYTMDLVGEGWSAYGLDQQLSLTKDEYEAGGEAPEACTTGYELVQDGSEACNAAGQDACERSGRAFGADLQMHLPSCSD